VCITEAYKLKEPSLAKIKDSADVKSDTNKDYFSSALV
jgi:hypothetical protein